MRTTTDTSVWVAGYYDDFASCRTIADDLNTSLASTILHSKTHHGNPMNGNAVSNPIYRYSYADRAEIDAYLYGSGDTFLAGSQNFGYSDPTKSNDGHHEWLTLDLTRHNTYDWEGKAQLQYPDSRLGNRQRFGGAAGDSYLAFANGHDTRGVYYCPLKSIDSTFGRSKVYLSNVTDNDGDIYEGANSHQRVEIAGQYNTHSVSLAGVLMG